MKGNPNINNSNEKERKKIEITNYISFLLFNQYLIFYYLHLIIRCDYI